MAIHLRSQPFDWTFRRVVWATLVAGSIALGFWLLYRFNQVVFILFFAVVIGTVVRPVSAWLNRRGLSRMAGVLLVYLLLLILLAGFLLLLFPLIVEQGRTTAAAVPGYYQSLREWAVNHPNHWIDRLSELLPEILPGLAPPQQTGPDLLASAGQALHYVTVAGKLVFLIIVLLVLAFHWTLDGPRTIQSFLLLAPRERRENLRGLVSAMETKITYYVAGKTFLCIVIGLMDLLAYLLIGLPDALLLATIGGVLEALPFIGPTLGAIPAGLVALSIAPSKLMWVVLATLVAQELENAVLTPRVMRKAIGVNPFVTLLAVFAFGTLFGIPGAFIAVPVAAFIQLIFDYFVFHPAGVEPEVPDGRDRASRLRYEAKDLAQGLRKQARLERGGSDSRVKQIDQVMDEIETITTDLDAILAGTTDPTCSSK